MSDKSPIEVDNKESSNLPSLTDWLSNRLGFKIPGLGPQSIKNLDKAIGRLILAGSDILEEKIRHWEKKNEIRHEFELEHIIKSEQERLYLRNKLAILKHATDQLESEREQKNSNQEDNSAAEIEDDWLNYFSRAAEDKSSEELQQIFGKILSGEIKRPGSFSLRTIHFLATLTRAEAIEVARFLAYAVGTLVPLIEGNEHDYPDTNTRFSMQESGLILGTPSRIAGTYSPLRFPEGVFVLEASNSGILVKNRTGRIIGFNLHGQPLSQVGREVRSIANLSTTDASFLLKVAQSISQEVSEAEKSAGTSGSSVHLAMKKDNGWIPYSLVQP